MELDPHGDDGEMRDCAYEAQHPEQPSAAALKPVR
jgi:hypothetical protein